MIEEIPTLNINENGMDCLLSKQEFEELLNVIDTLLGKNGVVFVFSEQAAASGNRRAFNAGTMKVFCRER
jgi:hypothetical protein